MLLREPQPNGLCAQVYSVADVHLDLTNRNLASRAWNAAER